MSDRQHTFKIVIRALFIAIIALQATVPMFGFIPLGFMSLTIIHITVIVAAIMLGPWDGIFVGLVWGVMTIVRAYTAPTTPLDTLVFTNPLVSVVPRVLVGLVAALVFWGVYKLVHRVSVASIVAAFFATLTNTIGVLFFMGILYTDQVASAYKVPSSGLLKVLGGLVVTNGIPEVIGAVIITPLIVAALSAATHIKPWRTATKIA
ncbi:ECF transporter S component [Lacticaseibacillus yichunensis]|uniref:ECF transporter S component n=1 Tax=Lacticaseibacillus yichunensis TaxID=2486015 RepID=A0ABW4CMZ1_9LACO|nr:ECF transporter S component [Lacticaseibacillus yichunensis]